MSAFASLWQETRPAFAQTRTWQRAKVAALSLLACTGRHTLTGLLTTSGQHQQDWSALYRLFERERMEVGKLWEPICRGAVALLPADAPIIAMLDDTLLPKRGRRVAGSRWRRDPLGPPFRPNFIWAQRLLQVALAVPDPHVTGRARAIPVALTQAPGAAKAPTGATAAQRRQHQLQQRGFMLSNLAVDALGDLRRQLDAQGRPRTPLLVGVDGGYTNRTLFRGAPPRTQLIGRLRKDAALFALPPVEPPHQGRRRLYGAPLATPEAIRQDARISWQEVKAYVGGNEHVFQLKQVTPVRWRGAGEKNLRLIIIRPLHYRLTPHSRLLYRDPAYLITDDLSSSLERLLQAYLWRWEIEVSFRDQKSLLGLGEPQVRTATAVSQCNAFFAASYALLHLAALQARLGAGMLPRPKWQRPRPGERPSTAQLISLLRAELCREALRKDLWGLRAYGSEVTKALKMQYDPQTALIYARN